MDEHSLDEVHREASILLARFLDPSLAAMRLEMARALRPLPEDYAKVFADDVADIARTGYLALWENLPAWPVRPEQIKLHVAVARSEDFVEGHRRAEEFPGGYRSVASLLKPGRIWVCWEFIAPERTAGVSFDGLVPLDGHWAWFPKPWRVLPSHRQASPMSHFTE